MGVWITKKQIKKASEIAEKSNSSVYIRMGIDNINNISISTYRSNKEIQITKSGNVKENQ